MVRFAVENAIQDWGLATGTAMPSIAWLAMNVDDEGNGVTLFQLERPVSHTEVTRLMGVRVDAAYTCCT